MRISDWSSDVCSSDLVAAVVDELHQVCQRHRLRQVPGMHEGAVWLRRHAHSRQRCPRVLQRGAAARDDAGFGGAEDLAHFAAEARLGGRGQRLRKRRGRGDDRSEEHTSELQSLMRISYAVFVLQKKKKAMT